MRKLERYKVHLIPGAGEVKKAIDDAVKELADQTMLGAAQGATLDRIAEHFGVARMGTPADPDTDGIMDPETDVALRERIVARMRKWKEVEYRAIEKAKRRPPTEDGLRMANADIDVGALNLGGDDGDG